MVESNLPILIQVMLLRKKYEDRGKFCFAPKRANTCNDVAEIYFESLMANHDLFAFKGGAARKFRVDNSIELGCVFELESE